MTYQQALTKALQLAITAPSNRLSDSLKLVDELAELCTPAEVAQAQSEALKILSQGDEIENN
tara:strand:+ start:906 stop:1091 length:186 start_codon:yes stop_codon:yes gene_type:complete